MLEFIQEYLKEIVVVSIPTLTTGLIAVWSMIKNMRMGKAMNELETIKQYLIQKVVDFSKDLEKYQLMFVESKNIDLKETKKLVSDVVDLTGKSFKEIEKIVQSLTGEVEKIKGELSHVLAVRSER